MTAPEMGFASMSIGWAFAFVSTALVVAVFFCGGKGDFARFQDENTGGASMSMAPIMKSGSGSSHLSRGSYTLDDTGKLKWQPAESSPARESQEKNENDEGNELDNEAMGAAQSSSVEVSGSNDAV